jgi:F0F1-type ATP synthase membrane subunit b/b'
MSRALPKYNKRRVAIIGGAAAVALTGAVIAGSALAGETSKSKGNNARTLASPGTITCPDVRSQLPAVPASAKAEVDRNLALLDTQIQEANKRLVDTVGQGGPNFVQNAILGPLKDKRVSTVNRIATAIGRTAAKPQGLDALAPCALNAAGTNAGGAKATPSAAASKPQAGGNTGNAGNAGNAAAAGTISCPDVKSKLPAVPASAKAEVDRNLALLNTQLQEANKRLASSVGQGGPNFVQNAILGPLADKRKSTIDRIAISIGRTAAKPQGLDSLAACTLTK